MNSTRDRIDIESRKGQDRLEREIDQQRDHIGDIVDALEHKLSPGQMLDRMMRFGKGNGGEMARNLGNSVKTHPLPALLASVGLVWLYASRNDPVHAAGAYPMPADGDEIPGEGLRDRGVRMRQGMSEKWHDTRDRAHVASDAMRDRAQRARSGFEHMLQDNPMAIGAMAVAAGALLGAALPTTEAEDRMMGDVSDRAKQKAKQAGSTAMEHGKRVAREVGTKDGGDHAYRAPPSTQHAAQAPNTPG